MAGDSIGSGRRLAAAPGDDARPRSGPGGARLPGRHFRPQFRAGPIGVDGRKARCAFGGRATSPGIGRSGGAEAGAGRHRRGARAVVRRRSRDRASVARFRPGRDRRLRGSQCRRARRRRVRSVRGSRRRRPAGAERGPGRGGGIVAGPRRSDPAGDGQHPGRHADTQQAAAGAGRASANRCAAADLGRRGVAVALD